MRTCKQPNDRCKIQNHLLVKSANILLQATGLALAFTADASAAFIGYYSPNNWSLNASNSNGFVVSIPTDSIQIEGSANQNENGNPGQINFTIRAETSGTWSFDWVYQSFDTRGNADNGGYLLNGIYNQLAQNDGPNFSGFISIPVNQNDVIGYRVFTNDNISDSGRLTISNFNAPTSNAAVPFNFSPTLGISLIGIWYGFGQLRKSWRFSKGDAKGTHQLSRPNLFNNQSNLEQ